MRKRGIWLCLGMFLSLVASYVVIGLPGIERAKGGSSSVIFSEIAWSGTAASSGDEWMELHNRSHLPVNLNGWSITGNNVSITLDGAIPPNGFFLLEREDDTTVLDIPADMIFMAGLVNTGDSLALSDNQGLLVDTANADAGAWPAGTAFPDFRSMERNDPWSPDLDTSWESNNALIRNGYDAHGSPINGTPGHPNSPWTNLPGTADIAIHKSGPSSAYAGDSIVYELRLENVGDLAAEAVVITDQLPIGLSYFGDDSGYPLNQPVTGTLIWDVGLVQTDTMASFHLTATIAEDLLGIVTNDIYASTGTTETVIYNNHAWASTNVITSGSPLVLIDAVYYDGYETNEPDEALRLINVGGGSANLEGWVVTDGLSSSRFPSGASLPPGESLWLSKSGTAFFRQFGFFPGFEAVDTQPDLPDLIGPWPGFSNSGDEVILLDSSGQLQDVLVYKMANSSQTGWNGPSLTPYTVPGVFAEEGQILYRKRDQVTGLPVTDTDRADDWAQEETDIINGRKVQYPGWNMDTYFNTLQVTETANFILAIAPDNAFNLIASEISRAQQSIEIATYSMRHIAIGEALVNALTRGVSVTVLLEGGPVGGIDNNEKYICTKIEEAGGQCWFMINDESQDIFDRYRSYHAKFMIIDGRRVLISTENLSPDSLPDDDKSDGTWGRRGIVLATNAPSVVEHMRGIWKKDLDFTLYRDLFRWSASHPIYGTPPPGMVPITATGGTSYTVQFPEPTGFGGALSIELLQSPENSLRDLDSLLGLLNGVGEGDTIFAQELVESPYWGGLGGDPLSDPNPRLISMIEAARRGAKVRLLLDQFFDDTPSSPNRTTCLFVNNIAANEDLDLRCALANPTGLGIHNKMLLVQLNGKGYLHIGSLNGSEISSKGNREIAIQIQSDPAYALLAELFERDWPDGSLLPIVFNDYTGPSNHALISEVLYDPYGPDDSEFIEIANPTGYSIDISGFRLGDALYRDDYEDVRLFPPSTVIGPRDAIIVATTATGFYTLFGFSPDFEILDTDPLVADLIDDPEWGDESTFLQLGNSGDEVILRSPEGAIIDAIGYGTGAVPGVVSCHLVSGPNHSLERFPYWRDTDNCLDDFREWPFPNPGDLP